MTPVAGVVLAAGRSSRFAGERPKQLFEIDGEPMVRRAVRTALGSRLAPVVVVVGHAAVEVRSALDGLACELIENPDFVEGQSTSVRAGLASLPAEIGAAMFLPIDQPWLTADTIDRLVAAWEERRGTIVLPVHEGRRGAPVLFDRSLFFELEALRGDTGGRAVFSRHIERLVTVEVENERELNDIDTREDLPDSTNGSPR